MVLRRGPARLLVFGGLLAVLVLTGPTAAFADDDVVRVRAASSFTAGGSPGGVSVAVIKRSDGCVGIRTALAIRLTGLLPNQVRVEFSRAGTWHTMAVSAAADDLVGTTAIPPERSVLCKDKSTSIRYRLTFLAGVPAGQATIVVGAYTGQGAEFDRGSDTARIVVRRGATPTPVASATPTPEATEPVEPVEEESATSAPAAVPIADDAGGGFFGIGTVVILLGLGMIGIGVALLVLLLRRNRAEREAAAYLTGHSSGPPPYPAPGSEPTQFLPRLPGH